MTDPTQSDGAVVSGDHKTPSRRPFGLILAGVISVVAVVLLTVVIRQNRELADLRSQATNEVDLCLRDEHLRYVYGVLLNERGGIFDGPSSTYGFDGGVRVAAGDRWCMLDANDAFAFRQLHEQLAFLAPLAFPRPAYSTNMEEHVEWGMALFANDLEQLKEAADKSPEHFEKRIFGGDVERNTGFDHAVVTTVTN